MPARFPPLMHAEIMAGLSDFFEEFYPDLEKVGRSDSDFDFPATSCVAEIESLKGPVVTAYLVDETRYFKAIVSADAVVFHGMDPEKVYGIDLVMQTGPSAESNHFIHVRRLRSESVDELMEKLREEHAFYLGVQVGPMFGRG